MGLLADGSEEVEEQGGVARLRAELPKVDKFVFENPKSRNFKKRVGPRMGMIGRGRIRMVGGGGGADRCIYIYIF